MRGPGEGPGSFALESALDELAEQLNLDPLELRLRNWAAWDQHANKPWSSNSLRECLQVAADAFEWKRRRPKGSMRDGRLRIGWGMAASYYPGFRAQAAARIRREAGGEIVLECGNQEVGNGAFTVMAQAAADRLGVPFDRVRVRYGDTLLPRAPMAAGSMNTASVIPAIDAAAEAFLRKAAVANVDAVIEAEGHSSGADLPHSVSTFGACFVEVAIDPDLGEIRVRRLTAAYAAGRILNAKLAHSQLVGGIVFGMGMALHERVELDTRFGLMTNRSLTDYLLPVHADMPEMQVYLIEEEDPNVPSGVKGLGMNGTVGTAAAIANAVYHATGIRVRDLPIFPEAVLITSPPSSRTARQQ
jgi:xanthine dehydrogenase YagR molybdenum-binding subunit